jgi:hypothetical protein
MCLPCDVRAEHGGELDGEVHALQFFLFNQAVSLGWVVRWWDDHGYEWWVVAGGPEGDGTVPLTEESRAFRTVRVDVVVPLFESRSDAFRALRLALGEVVDA